MKKDNVVKNFIFQILYQVIMLVLPMISAPYLTRVLGDYNLGVYTFTYSIAYYFVVFALLGIERHGQRIIASRSEDPILLRKTFWSLYVTHLFFSTISTLAYFIFAFTVNENKIIFIIQGIYVFSSILNITWLFYGLENFKKVVIKNAIIKILELFLIFLFVKKSDDLWIYTLIASSSLLLGHLILFPQAIKIVKPISFGWKDMKEHIAPLFSLFIVVIASTLYTVFDKTLLGWLSTKEAVAYYEYSNKIINIPKTIIGVIGAVLFPKACSCYSKGDVKGMKKYFKFSVLFTYFIGFASIFGLVMISNLLSVLYYGESFKECGKIIISLTPAIIIVGFGDIIRTQMILPMHKDFQLIIIQVLNAIINIVISVLLIPKYGVYGAVFGTLSAELFGFIAQIFICRKNIDFKIVLIKLIPFIIASLSMCLVIYMVRYKFNSTWFHLILQVGIGAICYTIIVAIYLLFIDSDRQEYRRILGSFFRKK